MANTFSTGQSNPQDGERKECSRDIELLQHHNLGLDCWRILQPVMAGNVVGSGSLLESKLGAVRLVKARHRDGWGAAEAKAFRFLLNHPLQQRDLCFAQVWRSHTHVSVPN